MARVLIFSKNYPARVSSGEFLRSHNYCRQLAEHHECYLVSFDELDFEPDAKQELGVIEWRILPPAPRQGRSRRRLLRLSNAHLLQLSVPDYLANTREIVRDLCLKDHFFFRMRV